MKSNASKRKSISPAISNVITLASPFVDARHRHQQIAIAAYYKAENRDFAPGLDVADWLEAEATFDERHGH
jgi:hypothetical protein